MKMVVSETFGPTVAGEGPSLGRRAVFLRLAGCNLSCSWCDTAYTWDWFGTSDMAKEEAPGGYDPRTEMTTLEHDEAAYRVLSLMSPDPTPPLLVVSGGEPLKQQTALTMMLHTVHDRLLPEFAEVEVETNGTIAPVPPLIGTVSRFNVSPKLAHSGDKEERRIVPDAIRALDDTGRAVWKFVVRHVDDLDAVAAFTDRFGIPPRRVWIMPEGRRQADVEATLARVADATVGRGYNLTTRLHIAAWGDKRGV